MTAEVLRRYGPALLAWGALLWLRPGPTPGRRSVRLCVLGLAVSQTLLTPAVVHLMQVVGLGGVERLAGHLAMLVAASAGSDTLLRLRGRTRAARVSLVWAAASGSLMALLFALTPDLRPQSPWVMEYCVAYAVALVPELVLVALLCLRELDAAADRALRLGLRLIGAGCCAAVGYMAVRTTVAMTARVPLDFPLGRTFLLSKALPTTAHVLVLCGVAVPALVKWLRLYRRYRRLTPLWTALFEAEPSIALEPPGRFTAVVGFPTPLRLYRRVIEIRDGLLAIRPYRPDPAEVPAQADKYGREALGISLALRARAAGGPPRFDGAETAGGQDLSSDTEYLCKVADAFGALPTGLRGAPRRCARR
ncbi:MAB_1171c family putative transporter [Streptomyces sp. SD11]|uniref:MAB_1171c family putative transporter n=1 Tax=Streptomyces sp. SD11 TaxID=3452209 RepID=UPI003F8B4005